MTDLEYQFAIADQQLTIDTHFISKNCHKAVRRAMTRKENNVKERELKCDTVSRSSQLHTNDAPQSPQSLHHEHKLSKLIPGVARPVSVSHQHRAENHRQCVEGT